MGAGSVSFGIRSVRLMMGCVGSVFGGRGVCLLLMMLLAVDVDEMYIHTYIYMNVSPLTYIHKYICDRILILTFRNAPPAVCAPCEAVVSSG